MKTLQEMTHRDRATSKPLLSLDFVAEWLTTAILLLFVVLIDEEIAFNVYKQVLHVPKYMANRVDFDAVRTSEKLNVATELEFDPDLAMDYREDTVPKSYLFLSSIFGPVIVSIFVQIAYLVLRQKPKWSWRYDLHLLLLTIAQSLGIALIFTVAIKVNTGRFRPDFYARLEGYMNGTINKDEVVDGQYSYTSGHAATAFASMTTLTLYLLGKTRLFSARHQNTATSRPVLKELKFLKLILIAGTLYGYATFVSITRITDHKHNYGDINAGAGIGILSAIAVYFLHFRSLTDDYCEYPRGVEAPLDSCVVEDTTTDCKERPSVAVDEANFTYAPETVHIV